MKQLLVLFTMASLSSSVLFSNAFAGAKICGQIEQQGTDLIFVQDLNGNQSVTSSIYSKDQTINSELSSLVGFREVCVEANADESDVVVTKILSRDE
jgi:hypothetical protein